MISISAKLIVIDSFGGWRLSDRVQEVTCDSNFSGDCYKEEPDEEWKVGFCDMNALIECLRLLVERRTKVVVKGGLSKPK